MWVNPKYRAQVSEPSPAPAFDEFAGGSATVLVSPWEGPDEFAGKTAEERAAYAKRVFAEREAAARAPRAPGVAPLAVAAQQAPVASSSAGPVIVPPEDRGQRLAVFRRGRDKELRVSVMEYEGSPYVALRVWERNVGTGVWWPVKGQGCSIRMREIREFAGILARLADSEDARVGV